MAWAPDYATLAEGRNYLRITNVGDTADDWLISLAITASSRAIDRSTGRQFGALPGATARLYTAYYEPDLARYVVDIDDLVDATGLLVKYSSSPEGAYDTTVTDYRLRPLNASGEAMPWTQIVFGLTSTPVTWDAGIQVTALWGWTVVPSTIKEACLLQMSRLVKRRDAAFGVAGSPEMGSEIRLLAKLDPDVDLLLASFRAHAWAEVI